MKVLINHTPNKGMQNIHKAFLQLNKTTKNPILKGAKDLSKYFSKKEVKMANHHRKRCSTQLVIRKWK